MSPLADGTYSSADTGDFLSNDLTEHGVWKRTGPRTIAITGLTIDFSGDAGEFIGYFRIRGTATISEDFQEIDGSFESDLFRTDQDPLTAPGNHSPLFYIDEDALLTGVRLMSQLAADFLLADE